MGVRILLDENWSAEKSFNRHIWFFNKFITGLLEKSMKKRNTVEFGEADFDDEEEELNGEILRL